MRMPAQAPVRSASLGPATQRQAWACSLAPPEAASRDPYALSEHSTLLSVLTTLIIYSLNLFQQLSQHQRCECCRAWSVSAKHLARSICNSNPTRPIQRKFCNQARAAAMELARSGRNPVQGQALLAALQDLSRQRHLRARRARVGAGRTGGLQAAMHWIRAS